jgi:prevent-host-death family protein
MDYIEKILPITKVKKEFLDVIKEMNDEESTITVTKNGMPVSVMMTPERYEGLLEKPSRFLPIPILLKH